MSRVARDPVCTRELLRGHGERHVPHGCAVGESPAVPLCL